MVSSSFSGKTEVFSMFLLLSAFSEAGISELVQPGKTVIAIINKISMLL